MKKLRVCLGCPTEFVPRSPAHRYCSPSCRPSQKCSCLGCGKPYVRSGAHPLYCSKRCIKEPIIPILQGNGQPERQNTRPSFDALYHRDIDLFAQRMAYTLHGITWWATPCCYCGDPAEADDHVLPISAFRKLMAAGGINLPDDLLRLVPSCHECNSLVNDKVFRTFEEKRLYVKAALGRRYHEALDYPHWEPQELDTLDGELSRWIRHGQGFRDLVFERLRF